MMKRVRKESGLPKAGGQRASNKHIRTPSYRKGHYKGESGSIFGFQTAEAHGSAITAKLY